MDYLRLRERMVEEQIESRGIRNPKVLDAFRTVPREEFVPPDRRGWAYEDSPVSIGSGQTISQPYMVALMTQSLDVSGRERVLEIGTGSGYQSAILAEIGCTVYSVERLPDLAAAAGETLRRLGYRVRVRVGDGTVGWEEHAPYDRVIVTAGGPSVPDSLVAQLADGGRLVMPVGDRFLQELVRVTKKGARTESENLGGCQFVPLKGVEGWPD